MFKMRDADEAGDGLELVQLAREVLDRCAASAEVAGFASPLVAKIEAFAAGADEVLLPADVSFMLRRMIARTVVVATQVLREEAPLAYLDSQRGGFYLFNLSRCETCNSEIEAGNSLFVTPSAADRRAYGAEALRAVAVGLAEQGYTIIRARLDEGWHDEETGMERCPMCEKYAPALVEG